jgi:hypothetical protein
MKKLFVRSFACVLVLLASANVNAIPIEFTAVWTLDGFSGAGGDIGIPGTAFGDTLTLSVIADNGGSSLLAQNWSAAQILSATLNVGSYTALYTAPFFSTSGFATNGVGALTYAIFGDIADPGNNNAVTDTFGTSTLGELYGNYVVDTLGRYSAWSLGNNAPNINLSRWSVRVASVPEPGTLSLFAAGLIALGVMRRRVAT